MTHVLVARMDNDGDVLLAGPAIRAVAAGADARDAAVRPRGLQAATLLPGVDEVLVHRAEWIDASPRRSNAPRSLRRVDTLAALGVDEAVILDLVPPEPAAARAAAAPRRRPADRRDRASTTPARCSTSATPWTTTSTRSSARCRWPRDGLRPARRRRRRAARCAPCRRGAPSRRLRRRPSGRLGARARWAPGATASWSRALVAAGWRVAVTGWAGGARARPAAVAGAAAHRPRRRDDLAGLPGVLAGAAASSSATRAPRIWPPPSGRRSSRCSPRPCPPCAGGRGACPHVLLHQDVPCAGCRARTCPVPGHPCIDDVSPAEVVAASAGSRARRAGRSQREHPAVARARLVDDGVRPGRTRVPGPGRCRTRARRPRPRPDVGLAAGGRRGHAARRRRAEVDVVILQRPRGARRPGADWLGAARARPPAIYLEHNAPAGPHRRAAPPGRRSRRSRLVVHVTHFNDLFWDCGATPTRGDRARHRRPRLPLQR